MISREAAAWEVGEPQLVGGMSRFRVVTIRRRSRDVLPAGSSGGRGREIQGRKISTQARK